MCNRAGHRGFGLRLWNPSTSTYITLMTYHCRLPAWLLLFLRHWPCWSNHLQRSQIHAQWCTLGLQKPRQIYYVPAQGELTMMLSDVCLSVCLSVWRLSDVCRVHSVGGRRVRPAGWMARISWSGSAGLAQGCRCALPLQAWGISWRPPAYSLFGKL